MITLHDLDEAIKECEGKRNPTSSDCVKLAAYLTIKNEILKGEKPLKSFDFENLTAKIDAQNSNFENYSFSAMPTENPTINLKSGTEFAKKIKNKDLNKIIEEVDELLTALSALNPRVYDTFMRRISKN